MIESNKPVAYLVTGGRTFVDRVFMTEIGAQESIRSRNDGARIVPLFTGAVASVEQQASQKDAARYRWLAPRLMAADFDWQESGKCALIFDWPKNVSVGGTCDQNVDAAIEAESKKDAGRNAS